jgi:hypothetical protein
MKLGYLTESARLADSPDTVLSEEPTVSAIGRTKGQLYLIATSRVSGARAREATRLAAEAVRDAYYRDESAGIAGSLAKAIRAANNRVAHLRDRLGPSGGDDRNGPLGLGIAVVRGNELYVATVGPAEAYLIRQARLSTLPDPHRERGLPSSELDPEVWRGEISVGDSLVLASENLVALLGADELKNAMLTLHPQSAMELLHQRFLESDGAGSDGAIAFEATEVSATTKQRRLVPVRAPEPLAGVPDRSPIPLADTVSEGVAAAQRSAGRARSAAGGVFGGAFGQLLDALPRRRPGSRRVTTSTTRRESQRRAATAVLAFVAVAASLGLGVWYLGGRATAPGQLSSITAGQKALEAAQAALGEVHAPGVDLVKDDPRRARTILTDAWHQLATAEAAGIPATATATFRTRISADLDVLFGMVDVGATQVFSFASAAPPVDLRALVLGPDGAPYVLDAATQTVYRIDRKAGKATPVIRAGQIVLGITVAEPRFIARGGPDLVILDAKNTLWRWRPADQQGRGTLVRLQAKGSASWGDDVRGIGTFLSNADQGLYRLYVIDPSAKQILVYTPAADGGGFPADPTGRLATPQDVGATDALVIDGDIWISQRGSIIRFIAGQSKGWAPGDPGDELLRPAPSYGLLATASDRAVGVIYGFDAPNRRLLAIDKESGGIQAQFRLDPATASGWSDLRGLVVTVAGDGDLPAQILWIDHDRLMASTLEGPLPSLPSPGPSSGSPLPGASGRPAGPPASAGAASSGP